MGLLSKAAARTNPGPDKKPSAAPVRESAAARPAAQSGASGKEEIRGIKTNITQYQKDQAPFQGIILDAPDRGQGGGRKFLDRIADMILCFGTVISLPAGRSLILLPASLDRELIAHRISRSLNTPALGAFETPDPEGAMKELRPFL
jgi:hypothetical protein